MASIDGIRLAHFQPGHEYEVGNLVGALLLAEGWGEPVFESLEGPSGSGEERRPVRVTIQRRPNLIREVFPPYFDHIGRGSRAADKARKSTRPRKRHTPKKPSGRGA
jgi:hypothetical protein